MGTKLTNLVGCKLRFNQVIYEGYTPPRVNYRATILNRPNNAPNIIREMHDWDDLLFEMEKTFSSFVARWPPKVIIISKDGVERQG